ncbi:DUF3971 domain-containing protein [Aestuariivirga litoralis]|uniref:YhdP family protein n=1 Tax=Aestuariivirga litoralis TaxID=2650924 RepID=UPI001AEDE205|nr:DUF3971 domain-containing protein [Aestuariivirga litoralis]MBG1231903.1 DUF3971 domain-containing protein [Aestuariivirga litoralis]
MKLNYLKIAGIACAVLVGAVLLLWGGLYLRLSQGPLAVPFVDRQITQAIASKLPGYQVSTGEAFIEIDPVSGRPRVAVKNIVVSDSGGNQIASAPQVAVSLSGWALLFGQAKAKGIEVIGPSISIRRNLGGALVLGFNASSDQAADDDGADKPVKTSTEVILNVLNGQAADNPLSSLDDIRISDAKFRFYDDGNAATWIAPRIAFDYRKTADGFVILANGDIATTGDPWHTEVSATYHHAAKQFEISSRVDNVVPASAARKIFALSQFAAVTTPLSGHVDMVLDETGKIISGSGELQAAKGSINLPDYFAEPIQIDEGAFNISFDPAVEALNLANSSVNIGGRRFELSGSVGAIRDDAAKLSALAIKLISQTGPQPKTSIEKSDMKPSSVVDRVEFSGKAGITKAGLDIDDLVVLSGSSGLRLRGNVTGGGKSPAIHMAGRLRDINLDIMRSLWPPVVAPKSRLWVFTNVAAGEIPEGTFQVNFDQDQLAQAREDHRNPPGSIDFTFSLKNLDTHYFKSLPNLQNGSGQAHVLDNSFALDLDGGSSSLENGDVITLNSGRFEANDIQAPQVLAKFNFEMDAPVSAMLAIATNPDLKMMNQDNPMALPQATGSGHIKLSLQMPLIKDPPPDQVQIATQVTTQDVNVSGLAPGVEVTGGAFTINLSQDKIDISGPAKINGLPAKVSWTKPRQGGTAITQVSLRMDEKSRSKLGMKLDDYLLGPVDADVTISKDAQGKTLYDVKADLSKATLKLATLSFTRPPTDGTNVSFKMSSDEQGRNIDDFKLDGDGLHLRGAIDLYKDGKLKSVTMPEIRLADDSVFSVRAIPNDGVTDLVVSGTNLDARPYIKAVLSPPVKQPGSASADSTSQDFTLRAHFDKVTANRGEALTNVTAQLRARAGKIAEANIQGSYLNGQQITATIVPLPDGRQMQVKSNDAGATMRAANLYSKVAGGTLNFSALIGNEEGSPMKNGNLTIRDFEVRNEATLAEVDKRGKPTKTGPRSDSVFFNTLSVPVSADEKFLRIKDSSVRGPSMCATADGVIRKSDNAIDISGTIVPACGLSRAFNNVPLLGDLLSGGNYNEGIFGLTYAMGGTFAAPKIQMNPLSFLAPGIFRRLFDFNPKAQN